MNPAELLRQSISGGELELLERLGGIAESRGERLCLVGGAMRDLMLTARSPDLDMTLQGDAIGFAGAAAAELGFDFTRHQAFGTATIISGGGLRVDIATARRETYAHPGALPDVAPDTIETDLRRRDFTINAMALSLLPADFGKIIDPFRGAADLSGKILRALHNRSFTDDPTRVLRGMRFSGRLDFSFDETTEKAIREALEGRAFDTVSGARIKKEIRLIFEEPERGRILSRCRAFGIGNAIQPGFEFGVGLFRPVDRVREAWNVLKDEERHPGAEEWLAGFAASAVGNDQTVIEELSERLNAVRKEAAVLSAASDLHSRAGGDVLCNGDAKPSAVAEAVERLHFESAVCVFAAGGDMIRANIKKYFDAIRGVKLEISGEDLISRGYRPSHRFGEALAEVLRRKRDGLVHGREEELTLVEKLLGETV